MSNLINGKALKYFLASLILVALLITSVFPIKLFASYNAEFNFYIYYDAVTMSNGNPAYKWRQGDFTSSQQVIVRNRTMSQYNVSNFAPPTYKYNCHSYAWYSVDVMNNIYWIDEATNYRNASTFLCFTSYSNTIPSYVKPKDKVEYYVIGTTVPHTALVDNAGRFVSKWGADGLYRHYPTEVPSIYICDYFRYYRS